MNRMSQWIAIALSCWFTWLIFITNTHHGSEGQADLVTWIVWLLFLVSLNSFRMEDEFLVQIRPKTHMLKAWADVNILAQVFMLTVTGHWTLAAVRGLAEVIARGNCNAAHRRLLEEGRTNGGRKTDADSGAHLHHQ